jgi:pyruvate,water dikinase
MRELGALLANAGLLPTPNDVFFLRRNEVPDLIWEIYSSWAVGIPPHRRDHWHAEVERRKAIFSALERQPPPPALGASPRHITEPFTIMLWGITDSTMAHWLARDDDRGDAHGLIGMPASPGVAEGIARVITDPSRLGEIQEGEILIAPLLSPSWGPAFSRIRAVVIDVGGMMSHAAVVCREYGLPAVTATVSGTTSIRTGELIRVDVNTGHVTLLTEPQVRPSTTRTARPTSEQSAHIARSGPVASQPITCRDESRSIY